FSSSRGRHTSFSRDWSSDVCSSDLLLQLLQETDIYRGIEPRPQGGVVTVTGELSGGLITIVVRNPVAERHIEREGNRLALSNIRERLSLMYGERALVKAGRFDSEYIVT